MSPKAHVIQSVLSSAALFPAWGWNVIPFGLSVVLIDLDHLFEYWFDTRDSSFRGFFPFFDILLKNLDKDYFGLSLFHTVEMYLLLGLFSFRFPVAQYVLAGFMFHHLADIIYLWTIGSPLAKAFSVTDYFFRRKAHVTSIRQILSCPDVRLEGISDIGALKALWNIR